MSVKRNIVANYVGQGVASLLSLGLVPVYIRYLGIEAYALVGLFAVIQSWMSVLDLGMGPTLGREMARFTAGKVTVQSIRDLLRSLEFIYFGLALAAAIALTAAAGWLAAHWLQADRLPVATVAGALSLLATVVALRFCEGLYRSGITGLQQQVWLNGATIILAVLRSFGALAVLAFIAPTIKAFFVWQGLVSLLSLAAMAAKLHLALPKAPRAPRFSWRALGEIRRFAGGILGISVLTLLLTQVDKVILSRMLPLTELGYYMLAATIAGSLYLLSAPIGLAVAPMLVRLVEAGDEAALSAVYHKSSQLLTVLLVPAALLLALFPGGVLLAWSGDPAIAARAGPILGLLAVGTFLSAQFQIPYVLQLAAGWTGLILRLNLAAVALLVPALIWAVPQAGAIAAAAASVALNLGYLLIGVPIQHRRLLRTEMWRWYRADVVLPAAGAFAACVPALLIVAGRVPSRLEWFALLALTGVASVGAAALSASHIRPLLVAAAKQFRRGTLIR